MNTTTQSFPRASRDNCLRSIGCVSGPYTSFRVRLLRRLGNGLLWVAACVLLVGMVYAPRFV